MSASNPIAATVTVAFTFADVVKFLLADKRVARLEWTDPEVFVELHGDGLAIHVKSEEDERHTWHPWILNRADLAAVDWVVL